MVWDRLWDWLWAFLIAASIFVGVMSDEVNAARLAFINAAYAVFAAWLGGFTGVWPGLAPNSVDDIWDQRQRDAFDVLFAELERTLRPAERLSRIPRNQRNAKKAQDAANELAAACDNLVKSGLNFEIAAPDREVEIRKAIWLARNIVQRLK